MGEKDDLFQESEVVWIGADFNGCVGEGYSGLPEIMERYGVCVGNEQEDVEEDNL